MGGSSKMLEPLAELLGGELTSGIPLLDYLLGWESVGHRPIAAPDDEPHRTGDDGRLGGQDQGPPEPHPAPTPAVHVSPAVANGSGLGRSEEHTSELQSLMRISYAVSCLQKHKKI